MKKRVRKANINWSKQKDCWVLRLWDDEKECFGISKMWSVKHDGEDSYGDAIDWVCDRALQEIAHLQDLGYEVTVTC